MPREDTQFKAGQSGNPNGRPKGATSKINKAYLDRLTADFMKHGESVLEDVRKDKPEVYIKLVAQLVPKELDIAVSGDITVKAVKFGDCTAEQLDT